MAIPMAVKKKGNTKPEMNINTDKTEKPAEEKKENKDIFGDQVQDLKNQAKELEETMDSFFDNNPSAGFNSAYSAAASSVPTIQVPVQTETKEGEVSIDDDQDGFSSVTIG